MKKCNAMISSAMLLLAFAGRSLAADAATLELTQTISLKGAIGKFDHLALDSKLSRLFIANKANNTLDIVDLKEGKLMKQVPDQKKISGVACAADLGLVAVGNGEGVCNIFEIAGEKLLYTVKLPKADSVRYHSKTKQFYVEHADKKLSVVDAKSGEVKAVIELPGAPEGFVLDSSHASLCICTDSPDRVVVIDTGANKIVAEYPVTMAAKNATLAVDMANHRAYIGCRKKPMVVVMDLKTGKELSNIEIPGDIDDICFDAERKRIYAICGEGFIAVLEKKDGDKLELVEKIATRKSARTGTFDPDTGRLFVLVPRIEESDAPEVRVYQAK